MSDPIEIEGFVTLVEITRALFALGATITFNEPAMPVGIDLKFSVDPQDAWDELPAWMTEPDNHEFEHDIADPRDLRDFLDACVTGDRPMQLALAPRLFVQDANLAVIERDLFRGGLAQ